MRAKYRKANKRTPKKFNVGNLLHAQCSPGMRMTDNVVLEKSMAIKQSLPFTSHCKERSDEAISSERTFCIMDCFAALAMTEKRKNVMTPLIGHAFALSPLRAFVPSRFRPFVLSRFRAFAPSCLRAC